MKSREPPVMKQTALSRGSGRYDRPLAPPMTRCAVETSLLAVDGLVRLNALEPCMPTGSYRSQRSIYDERYQTGLYDQRSVVRVLTAEREALSEAMGRALKSHPKVRQISLFDFGYGTGRVTNEMVANYADQYIALGKDLLVVAYDVSSAGLKKAQESLTSAGFTSARDLAWDPGALEGYIAGSIHKEEAGIRITVVFIHGREEDPPDVMHRLALRANDGDGCLVTTSWYSGLGHVVAAPNFGGIALGQIGGIACCHWRSSFGCILGGRSGGSSVRMGNHIGEWRCW